MHFFKDTPTNNDIIIYNLKLLNYDITDANKVFRMQVEHLSIENMNQHPKLIIHVMHFITAKTVDEDHYLNHFKPFYPPRTQLEQNVYKQELAEYLKNNNARLPRNFIVSKAMLDSRIMKFLRFMSEFALRNQFMNMFPTQQLRTVYTDPTKILHEDRPSLNDISDIYTPGSYQFENNFTKEMLNMPMQVLKLMTGICGHATCLELNNLRKVLTANCEFVEQMEKLVTQINEVYKAEREESIQLNQQLNNIKNQMSPLYLTPERKLDRKPQIDLSVKVFAGIQSVVRQFMELRMDQNMEQVKSTPRLDKFGDEDNLNILQDQYIANIDNLEGQLVKLEAQTWMKERAIKTKQNSQIILESLKSIRNSI